MRELVGGMLGVVIGGVLSIAATVWVQRSQAKSAVETERRIQDRNATTAALQALSGLRMLDHYSHAQDDHAQSLERSQLRLALIVATEDIRDPVLRERMGQGGDIIGAAGEASRISGDSESLIRWRAAGQAIECMGAYRRGEPIPEAPASWTATLVDIATWFEENDDST